MSCLSTQQVELVFCELDFVVVHLLGALIVCFRDMTMVVTQPTVWRYVRIKTSCQLHSSGHLLVVTERMNASTSLDASDCASLMLVMLLPMIGPRINNAGGSIAHYFGPFAICAEIAGRSISQNGTYDITHAKKGQRRWPCVDRGESNYIVESERFQVVNSKR